MKLKDGFPLKDGENDSRRWGYEYLYLPSPPPYKGGESSAMRWRRYKDKGIWCGQPLLLHARFMTKASPSLRCVQGDYRDRHAWRRRRDQRVPAR